MSALEKISEYHDRRIIWRETGDIVHFNLKGKLLYREKYSKKSLSNILGFLNRKPNAECELIAQFNIAAKSLMTNINGVDISSCDEYSISGSVNNRPDCKNKIYRHRANDSEITQLYIRNTSVFKANTRYAIKCDGDLIKFEMLEVLSSNNLNNRYDYPVLSIYVMDK